MDFKYKHLKAVDSQHVDLTVSTSMGLHMFIMLVLIDLSKFKTKEITNKYKFLTLPLFGANTWSWSLRAVK